MKKEVKYSVVGEEWKNKKDEAFKSVSKNAKVDGFRKGKVPRKIFEKNFPGKIEMEAANKAVDSKYMEVISSDEYKLALQPEVSITKLDDDGVEFTFTLVLQPEAKLGKYTNLKAKKKTVKVGKDEIQSKIDELLKNYAELVVKEDGEVETGDVAVIDYEGFKDGVAFEGGKGENYSLEIGSNTFIPGFEDGVKGMKLGETKDINLTFPKDYGVDELDGAEVVFKVTVKEIKRKVMPELDEDFFADLGMEEVTNKEELEAKIKEELKDNYEKEYEREYVDELLKEAVSDMECDIDDKIVLAEANGMYEDFIKSLESRGLNEEMYLSFAKTTKDDILEHMKDEALTRLQNTYLIDAIINKENIDITDEESKKELASMAKEYNMMEEDLLNAIGGEEMFKHELKVRKVIDILKSKDKKESK